MSEYKMFSDPAYIHPPPAQPESEPPVRVQQAGSAAVASADAYGEIGREALRQAQRATGEGKFGMAEGYRKDAEMAFRFELQLRQPPNAEVSDRRPAASESSETHNGGSLH